MVTPTLTATTAATSSTSGSSATAGADSRSDPLGGRGRGFSWDDVVSLIGLDRDPDSRAFAEPSDGEEILDDPGLSTPLEPEDLSQYLSVLSRVDDPDPEEMAAFEDALCRASLSFFASSTLRGDPAPPYDGRFLVSEHHEEWSDLVMDAKRLCVLAPRDHGKTYFFDFAYPIWMAWKHPGRDGFIFSATQTQAQRILRDIREEIEDNPRLRHLTPAKKERWNDNEIRLANGHTIYARGFGTKVRGAHPVWIVCDDVLNDETAYSEVQRRKQNDYFFSAIVPMCVPGGTIVVVGTPFHSLDLYAEIQGKSAWTFKRYQALNACKAADGTVTHEALWPERYSLEYLFWKRDEDVGAIRFAREYLCQPISDDMSLFPSWLFQGKPAEQPTLKLGMEPSFWKKLDLAIYVGVDFAISASAKADYTAICVLGVDPRGNRYILDLARYHGLPYVAQKSKIIAMARKWSPDLVYLEANQMQRIFGQELIRETDLPIKPYDTGAEKHSLERGLPGLRMLLENGKFRIPRGDAHSVEMTELLISELGAFTFDGGKVVSVGEHDDMAMALWICDQAVRAGGGFSATFTIEDTMDRRDLRKRRAGQKVFESVAEIIERQTEDGREAPEVPESEPEDDADPFTGLPLGEDGELKEWRPREGAPVVGGWRF